jgi:hypothetical protein
MNFKNYLLAFALVAVVMACTQKNESKESLEMVDLGCKPSAPDTAYDAIDTVTAWTWIKNYRDTYPEAVRYFTVASTDLWETMGMHDRPKPCSHFPNARVYVAMDSTKRMHLLFCPADASGKPVWLSGKYTRKKRTELITAEAISTGTYALDFTQPCPTTCIQ